MRNMQWQVTVGLKEPIPESRQKVSELVSSLKAWKRGPGMKKGAECCLVTPVSISLVGHYNPKQCLFYETPYEGHARVVKNRLEGNSSVTEVYVEMVTGPTGRVSDYSNDRFRTNSWSLR